MADRKFFVVIDPTDDRQLALKRAEQLAVDGNADLHLFCCVYIDDLSDFHSRKDAKHSAIVEAKNLVAELAQPLRSEGIKVTTEVIWNKNWQSAVVQACSREGADLVIKTSSSHNALYRQMKKTSDYTLLRQSPCAVLLVKNDRAWMNQRVMAALAFVPKKEEHEQLNRQIISAAQRLCNDTLASLHVVSALKEEADISSILKLIDTGDDISNAEEIIAQHYGVNPDRVTVKQGKAKQVICDSAAEINADVAVIGTVARKGVKAALIGNTAEKVLDGLDLDLLVVN